MHDTVKFRWYNAVLSKYKLSDFAAIKISILLFEICLDFTHSEKQSKCLIKIRFSLLCNSPFGMCIHCVLSKNGVRCGNLLCLHFITQFNVSIKIGKKCSGRWDYEKKSSLILSYILSALRACVCVNWTLGNFIAFALLQYIFRTEVNTYEQRSHKRAANFFFTFYWLWALMHDFCHWNNFIPPQCMK